MLLSSHKCVFSFYRMGKGCHILYNYNAMRYEYLPKVKSDKDKEPCVVKLLKGRKKCIGLFMISWSYYNKSLPGTSYPSGWSLTTNEKLKFILSHFFKNLWKLWIASALESKNRKCCWKLESNITRSCNIIS